MKASVIVPSRPSPSEPTLPQTLQSLNNAAQNWSEHTGSPPSNIEIVVSWDEHLKGPSWARNRGLERAQGEYVFFCDADDTVTPEFFMRPIAALDETRADLCFFTYTGGPRLEHYVLTGRDQIRAAYLPAFFGYSMEDVRRWNAGGKLGLFKEPGQVWRCAYRRAFLEKHRIRFDERMTFFEDAAFLSQCVSFAENSVSLSDELYVYRPSAGGNLNSGWQSRRHWDYKFLIKAFRERLDDQAGGELNRFCEASHVFSALEMLRSWRRMGLSRTEARADLKRYLSDVRVCAALRAFPLSFRHPLTAAAVLYLRRRSK